MKLRIKRIDTTLPLPTYLTKGSVCFDLYSRIDISITSGKVVLIPTNLIVKVPKGYLLMIASRSSTPVKKGLLIPNGVGIIDQDYHGPDDEIKFIAYNFTDALINIKKGDRIAQACLVSIETADLVEVIEMNSKNRGGIGSTG